MAYTRAIKPNYGLDVANCYVAFIGNPLVADVDKYVTTTTMGNKTFTLADTISDDNPAIARNVTVSGTQAGGTDDTFGKVLVTGLDVLGAVITEELVPVNGSTVAGVKCFASLTSVSQSGWTIGGTTADNITVGFGTVLQLPPAIRQKPAVGATGQVFLVIHNNAIVAAPTLTYDASVLSKNTIDVNAAATYNGTIKTFALIYR